MSKYFKDLHFMYLIPKEEIIKIFRLIILNVLKYI